MRRKTLILLAMGMLAFSDCAFSHCQMPCGIYHDDMVFEMIDQYLETMYKATTELGHLQNGTTLKDKNQFVRWVIEKENASNEASKILTEYFLQQKIKPDEEDTPKKLIATHKLLFLIVRIKQNADLECVKSFADEWGKFKLFFHIEGYECEMEKRKLSQWEKIKEAAEKQHAEEHKREAESKKVKS